MPQEMKILTLAFVIILLISIVANVVKENQASYKFGFEYGKIAASVANGKGYANIFTDDSGSTAWMLPLYTYLTALIFYIFGVYTIFSFWAMVVVNSFLWALTLLFIWKVTKTANLSHRYFVVLSFVVLLLANYYKLLVNFMDVALINALAAVSVYALYSFIKHGRARMPLIILAALLPLAAPSLFLAFVVILAVYYFYSVYQILLDNKNVKVSISTIFQTNQLNFVLLLSLPALFSMSIWSARNYGALNSFIPSKSNLWYEFYQANMVDEDGILDNRTISRYHPSHKTQSQMYYQQVGESLFVEHFKNKVKEEFSLPDYLEKVSARGVFAFFYSISSGYQTLTNLQGISPADWQKLNDEVLVNERYWTSLHLSESQFLSLVSTLNLENEEMIVEDWYHKKASFVKEKNSLISIFKAVSISLIPSICLMIGLIVREIRNSTLFKLIWISYIVLLLPYVIVSHDIRYQTYGIALQTLLISLVVTQFVSRKKLAKLNHAITF